MIAALLLLAGGILLSAFFSGSETGFYRLNRVKLVLDTLGGDFIAGRLLWMANHSSLLVATVLVGNNLANYVTSLAVVIGVQAIYQGPSQWPAILAPVALAPLLFVFGELMPKKFYYEAPNRMLRRSGLMLLVFTWLFSPITAMLWGLSKLLGWLVGETPQKVQLALARKELQQVLEEGHDQGILRGAQRSLAQGLFAVADKRVTQFLIPSSRITRVAENASLESLTLAAQRSRLAVLPVENHQPSRQLVGYLRVVDLHLHPGEQPPIRSLVAISSEESYLSALMQLEASDEDLGQVVDATGRHIGFVSARHLSEPLLRG